MGSREERIARMPAHQQPSPRELGRRSEAADHPFKAIRADEVGGRGHGSNPAAPVSLGGLPPLVTSFADRQKMVIGAADDAALALGLAPGMALTHARVLVPELDVRDGDPAADAALLHRLALFAVRRWTPTAMVDDDHGLLMDLTGVAHLHGGEETMARRVIRFCARLGVTARMAVAGNIGAAHALARFGGARVAVCEEHGEPEALAPLPVAALRLTPAQKDAARRLGIESVGDLLAMPRGPVAKRFGASLIARLDQAIGRLPEPFDALVPFEVPQEEMRFAEPIGSAEPIAAAMAELVGALCETLRHRSLGARVVRLTCDRVDREDQVVAVGMARGTRDVRHILRLLGMKVETIEPGYGIDAMRLVAVRTEPLGPSNVEGDLAGVEADLASLVDQIATRLGAEAVFRSSAVETHVPERSVRLVHPSAEPVDWPSRWPRPARILRRPEPLDGVIALLPDQPPRRFVWRGRMHVVARADGPERLVGEWWKRTSEAYSVRDYFRLEDERGERFWIFRRGDGQSPRTGDLSWHMHGFFG